MKGETLLDTRIFTPTQRLIMNVLSDCLPHKKEEICMRVWGEFEPTTVSSLHGHFDDIRKIIRRRGLDIICQFYQKQMQYRLIQLVSNPYDGRT